MTTWKRARVSLAAIGIGTLALAVAGCASGRVATRNISSPEPIQPLPSSQVASANLPEIGASGAVSANQLPDGRIQTAQIGTPAGPVNPALTGQPVLGGTAQTNASGGVTVGGDPIQTASTDGSFVTLDAVGEVPNAPGRDLTGGLTIEKLLGGWTIVSGADQCKLNLTYTSKSGTSRYRASTPGCQLSGLRVVASWQLAGSQVQLFDENGDMVAALILSGNRFIGTLSGGQGISMVG
jgi:hypothetical protein